MIGVCNLLQDRSRPAPALLRHRCRRPASRSTCSSPGKQASLRAITGWAHRFGSVVTKHPHHDERGQFTRVTATFGYYGLTVKAYAYIPAAPASI